jgi:hypothetical protein
VERDFTSMPISNKLPVDPDWQPLPKIHPPDTGGPSLLLVASALLFFGGVQFYAVVKRKM